MSSFACCVPSCGGKFCFDPVVERRLRRTHEWFTCPFGHRQAFQDKTDEEIEIARLKKEVRQRDDAAKAWLRHYNEAMELWGTCPVMECGWESKSGSANRWRMMLRHFYKAHPIIMGDSDLLDATRKPPLEAVS